MTTAFFFLQQLKKCHFCFVVLLFCCLLVCLLLPVVPGFCVVDYLLQLGNTATVFIIIYYNLTKHIVIIDR